MDQMPGRAILARVERLPRSRHMLGLVLRIASGGWFEFYELFMPGFISLGLIRSGILVLRGTGPFDPHAFANFLASFFLGMFISTFGFGFLSDRFGRRVVFIWSMVVYSVAQLFVGILSDALLIDLARFVAGLAVGMQLVNNDSYIAELVPRADRGRYMGAAFIFILTAVPVAAFLSELFVPHDPFGVAGWRYVVLIGAAGGLAVWFLQRRLPESPRWLETHGQAEVADRVVAGIEARVAAERGPLPPPDPSLPDLVPVRGDWREMFGPFYRARTIVISLFQFCQTIAVFGFTAFVPILLVHKGFTIVHSLTYTAMIVLLTPIGALVGAVLADRIERKWQLVATALLILVAGFGFAAASSVPMVLLTGGLVALGNNWLIAIFHPYAAELFPTRIRASAVGFTFAWSRVSSIFVGFWVADLLASFGPIGVFVMIAAAMLVIIVGIAMFGPKTNGRSLEELSP